MLETIITFIIEFITNYVTVMAMFAVCGIILWILSKLPHTYIE